MAGVRGGWIVAALAVGCAGLSGCAEQHQLQRLPSPDGTFVLVIYYVTTPVRTHDVIVSLEEKQGIATEIAVFRDIHSFSANWLGPEDINICQTGKVQDYKTHVTINAHNGNQEFHFHYDCQSS